LAENYNSDQAPLISAFECANQDMIKLQYQWQGGASGYKTGFLPAVFGG
jgi:hypothetical protein